MFHVFEGHLKSWQLVESEVRNLETEIEEWKRKYKNLEKEKEDLFNEMTQIIHLSGYEPLNLENGLLVNSANFDATNLRL